MPLSRRQFALGSLALGSSLLAPALPAAETKAPARTGPPPVIPGTGIRIARTGDDFEDFEWVYYPSGPKSSWNIDENMRVPGGLTKTASGPKGPSAASPT